MTFTVENCVHRKHNLKHACLVPRPKHSVTKRLAGDGSGGLLLPALQRRKAKQQQQNDWILSFRKYLLNTSYVQMFLVVGMLCQWTEKKKEGPTLVELTSQDFLKWLKHRPASEQTCEFAVTFINKHGSEMEREPATLIKKVNCLKLIKNWVCLSGKSN